MTLENLAEPLNMDLQLRQYQISKNDDKYMHEKPHEYNRPLDYQMDKINQEKLEDAAWHLKGELGDDVGRDIPIEWCQEVLSEVLQLLFPLEDRGHR